MAHAAQRSGEQRNSFWDWFLFQGYSGDSLGILRMYFGFGFLIYHFTQFAMVIGLNPFGAPFQYLEQIWYFKLLGITHLVPWLSIPVFIILCVSTVTFALGKHTRTSIIVMMICIFYLKGVRDSIAGDVHHRYLIPFSILVLFLFSRSGEVWSYDGRKKAPAKLEEWEASWPIRVAQIQVIMFYFWAVVAKLRISGLDWFGMSGKIQEKLIQRALRGGYDENGNLVTMALAFEVAQVPELPFMFGIVVLVFECFAPIVLFWRTLWFRVVFLCGAGFFHLSNFILMNVQFFFYPFVFFIFFDLVPMHRRLLSYFGRQPVQAGLEPARQQA